MPEKKTNLQIAASKIDFQVQLLDNKIDQAEKDIRYYVSLGRDNGAAKLRATRLIHMKKMMEEQRANLIGTQFNVEELQAQQSQADVALSAIQAMKASEAEMRKQQQQMPVDMVDDLRMDMQQTAEEIQAISACLAESGGLYDGSDDAAMEELARLEAEMAASGAGVGDTSPAVAAKPAPKKDTAKPQPGLFTRRPIGAV